jgi:predicted nuclease of predicted toxin-antitoxin system
MKLLLDQNLSFRLVPELSVMFPGSTQVNLIGKASDTDRTLWDYAKGHGFAIVTKDADFAELAAMNGHPPKVILLKFGNVTNDVVRSYLLHHLEAIEIFLAGADDGVLEIE